MVDLFWDLNSMGFILSRYIHFTPFPFADSSGMTPYRAHEILALVKLMFPLINSQNVKLCFLDTKEMCPELHPLKRFVIYYLMAGSLWPVCCYGRNWSYHLGMENSLLPFFFLLWKTQNTEMSFGLPPITFSYTFKDWPQFGFKQWGKLPELWKHSSQMPSSSHNLGPQYPPLHLFTVFSSLSRSEKASQTLCNFFPA